jgi:hypothetical protein
MKRSLARETYLIEMSYQMLYRAENDRNVAASIIKGISKKEELNAESI